MTNTRITDAEIFERRYPVILREFSLRKGSGGRGQHVGGDGVVRDIEFRREVQVSILSERRVRAPYGLEGGEDAMCGVNVWVRRVPAAAGSGPDGEKGEGQEQEYRHISLGGKNTAAMRAGERIIISTPGGGGWGREGAESRTHKTQDPRHAWRQGSVASRQAEAEASA